MSVRITCINKDAGNHDNPHEAISFLGWINENTKQSGKVSRIEMYDWIREKGGEAYVRGEDGTVSLVGTAITNRGTKYVRTYANGVWNDNLLSLPEC